MHVTGKDRQRPEKAIFCSAPLSLKKQVGCELNRARC